VDLRFYFVGIAYTECPSHEMLSDSVKYISLEKFEDIVTGS